MIDKCMDIVRVYSAWYLEGLSFKSMVQAALSFNSITTGALALPSMTLEG